MASWRCPHCDAPQTETARCWVCNRSMRSCASCRFFRKAVAVQLGYCALDRHHDPLTGEEEFACWERPPAEMPRTARPALDEGADSAPASGGSLWGAPAPSEAPVEVPPDTAARSHGLRPGTDSIEDSEAGRGEHGGSIRSRPWDPVPGVQEPTGRRRGIRTLRRS